MKPLVFVTVGTDHHPFHRVVGWVDRWLEDGAGERVRCRIQFGTSSPPRLAEGSEYLGYPEMEASVAEAAVVVCHGGPGSVMMCRWMGKRPIVVPRRHDLGEHVDDHQLAFSRRMADEGELDLAEDEDRLRHLLERALAGGTEDGAGEAREIVARSLARFEELVDGLFRSRAQAAR